MKIKIFSENLAQVNSYLLYKDTRGILFDPGFNGNQIIQFCKENEIYIGFVILTHGHFDHIKDMKIIANQYEYHTFIEENDYRLLFEDENNYAKAFGSKFILPKNTVVDKIKNGDTQKIYGEDFKFISTPGHTKGSMCIKHRNLLFSGDTLFYNSVGRTDLFSGNRKDMYNSIDMLKNKISNDVMIYPGHGQSAKMKAIKEVNQFLK
ncbi:MBL fold metallo-hydrolase [Mycoplasmatota bacterium WC30]